MSSIVTLSTHPVALDDWKGWPDDDDFDDLEQGYIYISYMLPTSTRAVNPKHWADWSDDDDWDDLDYWGYGSDNDEE
jgi:hypothetical protein